MKNDIKWINPEVITKISHQNNEPAWMLKYRLNALEIFNKLKFPAWWPDLNKLNLNEIYFYINSKLKNVKSWDNASLNIKNIFENLWVIKAEKKILAWSHVQYDNKNIYHNLKDSFIKKWIIFEDMNSALKNHWKLIKKYFAKIVPIQDHKFAALHYAFWSGGTFLYIPKWVKLNEPLQAYFRMNHKTLWQFEHTLIILEENSSGHYIEWCSAKEYLNSSLHAWCVEILVWKNSKLRYSSIENWSKNTFNLNTKRAIIKESWFIEWVWWNMWAWVTMLYPCSVLLWDNSKCSHFWIAFANKDQIIDAWAKIIHIGKNTSSNVSSKSLSKSWGSAVYRWLLEIKKSATNAVSKLECDWLILDKKSSNNTFPKINVQNTNSTVAHETKVWKINETDLFYLQSRWINKKNAEIMLVNWFISPIIKTLPLEYAAEMNTLINMEI